MNKFIIFTAALLGMVSSSAPAFGQNRPLRQLDSLPSDSITRIDVLPIVHNNLYYQTSVGGLDSANAAAGSNFYWKTTGNTGTNPGSNFCGTSDSSSFRITSNSNIQVTAGDTLLLDAGTVDSNGVVYVNNQLQYAFGDLEDGSVIISDSFGNASWELLSSLAWVVGGNFLTGSPIVGYQTGEIVGTADGSPLNFLQNNTISGTIDHNTTSFGYYTGTQCCFNSFFGSFSGNSNPSGYYNTGFGYASVLNITTGTGNTVIGANGMPYNVTGSYNTMVGDSTGYGAIVNGPYSFSNNTCIGAYANMGDTGVNNATAIGYGAVVSCSNGLVLGRQRVFVGIGTSNPSMHGIDTTKAALVDSGQFVLITGNEGDGKILSCDSNGLASWIYPAIGGTYSQSQTAVTSVNVTIPAQANNAYQVTATAGNTLSAVAYYVDGKTTTQFTIHFAAALTGTVAFDWILTP